MRVFIAIDLPEGIRKKISAIGACLPGMNSTVAEKNLHITLQFIGNIDESTLSDVKEAVKSVSFKPFKADVKGLSYFGANGDVHVVYANIKDGKNLQPIYSMLCDSLSSRGLHFDDDKEYVPHITIARPKPGNSEETIAFVGNHSEYLFGSFEINSICVKKSVITGRGPVYETLYENKLP